MPVPWLLMLPLLGTGPTLNAIVPWLLMLHLLGTGPTPPLMPVPWLLMLHLLGTGPILNASPMVTHVTFVRYWAHP